MEGELDPDLLELLQQEAIDGARPVAELLSAEDVEMLMIFEADQEGFADPI